MNTIPALLSCAANLGQPPITRCDKCISSWEHRRWSFNENSPLSFFSMGAQKAFYGLKQSRRAWFSRFQNVMLLFSKKSACDWFIVYIDDIIITEDRAVHCKRIWIERLGSLILFLGIEVVRPKKEIFISQRKHILDLLKETGMLECKSTYFPIEVNHKLRSIDGKKLDKERYQRLVWKLPLTLGLI